MNGEINHGDIQGEEVKVVEVTDSQAVKGQMSPLQEVSQLQEA